MLRQRIQRAELRQAAQFFFRQTRRAASNHRSTRNGAPLARCTSCSACSSRKPFTDAKPEPNRVVGHNRATPIRAHHADRLHLHPMPLRILHDRRRRVETHRLIVQQAGVKLRRAMHLQIGAAIGENREADRVRLRKSVERKRRDRLQNLLDRLRRDVVLRPSRRAVSRSLCSSAPANDESSARAAVPPLRRRRSSP